MWHVELATGNLSPADYDGICESAEYKAQVNPLKATVDPEEFLRHGTYAPFFREVPMKSGDSLLDVGVAAWDGS